jgi:hypothetical protein
MQSAILAVAGAQPFHEGPDANETVSPIARDPRDGGGLASALRLRHAGLALSAFGKRTGRRKRFNTL